MSEGCLSLAWLDWIVCWVMAAGRQQANKEDEQAKGSVWMRVKWSEWKEGRQLSFFNCDWNEQWKKRAPLPPSLNERNGAQPKRPMRAVSQQHIQSIILCEDDWWMSWLGAACSPWLGQTKSNQTINNCLICLACAPRSLSSIKRRGPTQCVWLDWKERAKNIKTLWFLLIIDEQ